MEKRATMSERREESERDQTRLSLMMAQEQASYMRVFFSVYLSVSLRDYVYACATNRQHGMSRSRG